MDTFLYGKSIWEVLTAIGTVSAVIVSLCIAIHSSKRKITLLVAPDNHFQMRYDITLLKNPFDYFVIKEVGIIHRYKKEQFSDNYQSIELLNQKEEHKDYRVPFTFSDGHIIKISLYDVNLNQWYGKNVRFYIKDLENKIFKSNKIKLEKLEK